jgi:hypothetical protein
MEKHRFSPTSAKSMELLAAFHTMHDSSVVKSASKSSNADTKSAGLPILN